MRGSQHLNGCDYLMLGFDHELRRRGFAGNSCQIVLELPCPISPAALQRRLEVLLDRYPILGARPGGLFLPRWKLPRVGTPPLVRVHRGEKVDGTRTRAVPTQGQFMKLGKGARTPRPREPIQPENADEASALPHELALVPTPLAQRIFNEPLATPRGQLIRFDLLERVDGRMTLIFTWAHALMDAPGAEHFLALVGREEWPLPAPASTAPNHARLRLGERCKLAWKNLNQIDQFGRTAPRCLKPRYQGVPAMLRYHVERFSPDETERVRANGVRHCGILGDAQYHAAVAVLELHHLHQRLDSPSPSYVLPVPVGMRPKGSTEPLFSNQVAMLMIQFLPEHLDSVAHAAATLKAQTEQALRAGLLKSSRILGELSRVLPLPIYMAILKQGLRGEICSLFFGDTAAVSPLLTSFLGVAIEDFTHAAAVTPSPGLGTIFYYFHGALRVTLLHSVEILSEAEATEFAASLRARLLNPDP